MNAQIIHDEKGYGLIYRNEHGDCIDTGERRYSTEEIESIAAMHFFHLGPDGVESGLVPLSLRAQAYRDLANELFDSENEPEKQTIIQ